MSLTPSKFIQRFRSKIDDLIPEDGDDSAALWTTAELEEYFDRAQQALCEHTQYLLGELTAPVIAEREWVTLPSRVTNVRGIRLESTGLDLDIRNLNEMGHTPADDYGLKVTGKWRQAEGGPPQIAILDIVTNRARLMPIPAEDDRLIITGELLPREYADCDDTFSIRPHHAWAMENYMKYLAYSKHDADAYDPDLSLKYQAQAFRDFDAIYHEIKKLRRSGQAGSGTTRYGGIPL